MSRSPVLMQKSRGRTTNHIPSTGRQRKEEARSFLARQSSQISELQVLRDTLFQKQGKKTLNINLWHVSLHRHTHSIKMLSYEIEKVEEHTPTNFFLYKLRIQTSGKQCLCWYYHRCFTVNHWCRNDNLINSRSKCCLLSAFSSYNLSIPYISLAYLNT